MTSDPVDHIEERFAIFCTDADNKTPARAAADLRRLGVDDGLVDALVERYEEHVGLIREVKVPHYMQSGGRITWYAGPRPTDPCWPKLVKHLKDEVEFEEDALKILDDPTTRVVSLLEHPQTVDFATKGLVLGHVQSGKTTNYTGVIAKAADRGYRLVIVLAGIHNELRRQTQSRLTRQLVDLNPGLWQPLTNPEKDFYQPIGAQAYFAKYGKQKVLCVVKKNATVLRRLIEWLQMAEVELRDTPALVIDDEADQAAVATKTINPLIRKLLGVLPRVAYVGYTATPFANLLIDPASEDLYPKDFIVDLPQPQRHFGTESLFGREPLDGEDPADFDDNALDMVRIVPDDEVPLVRPGSNKEVDGFTPHLAGELRKSVLYFWLATAARRRRGGGSPHSTMLVHTSVRVAVHQSFKPLLDSLRDSLVRRLEISEDKILAELRTLWDAEKHRVNGARWDREAVSFDQLLESLPAVLAETRVVLDNSWSEDRLDYTQGPQVAIAVGGNTLSRGLTLEGLIVSYFVRSASAYDTLLQMGRWFGYRDRYEDLPRIWMTAELEDWFRHISGVEAEIRRDIARYMQDDVNPLTFAVRIRKHPSLTITAAAKMRDAVTAHAAYGGLRVQTRYYRAEDDGWLTGNQRAAQRLVAELSRRGKPDRRGDGSNALWRDADPDIVAAFLDEYQVHEKAPDNSSQLMAAYARKRRDKGKLERWSVALIGSGKASRGTFRYSAEVEVPKVVRSKFADSRAAEADIKTLMSRRDAAIDLAVPDGEVLTESRIVELRREQAATTGLLTIYAIDRISEPLRTRADAKRERAPLDANTEAIGIGVVFPKPLAGDDDDVYVQADLSRVSTAHDDYLEEEDLDALEAFQE